MMNRIFRTVFPEGHVVLPVIHVSSPDQACRNAEIAHHAGADGVFLINHSIRAAELLDIHAVVSQSFSEWWIGVNCLDLPAVDVIEQVSDRVSGIWSDDAMILEMEQDQSDADEVLAVIQESGWAGLYFGGVAFKYQRHVDDLRSAASIASRYMNVVTTSGPGTGKPAHVEKIQAMKAAIGDFPLAIASGITPDNVQEYLPYSDCYLVATGVSKSFEELDPAKVSALVNVVRTWDKQHSKQQLCADDTGAPHD